MLFDRRGVTQEDSSCVTLHPPAARLWLVHLVKEGVGGERTTSHVFQLQFTNLDHSSTSVVLFDLPAEHADRHHEKERGEEDGEKHEQVDLRQVLSEVHQAFGTGLISTDKHHVEPSEQKRALYKAGENQLIN